MPKQANTKKSDKKPSKKQPPAKQEKPLKDIRVKHAPPVSSKDIIAKAEANAAKPLKSKKSSPKTVVKKTAVESSSSDDSSDSESESDSRPPKAATQETKTNGKLAPPKRIIPTQPLTSAGKRKVQKAPSCDSSSDSDSSSDDSSSEDEAPAKPTPLAKANGTSEFSESDGSSVEESSKEDTSNESTTGTGPSTAQKAAPSDDSSDSEGGSSEDEKPKAQQIKTVPQPSANSSTEESSSSSEDSASDSDSDTSTKTPAVTSEKIQPTKGSSSNSDSSSDEESPSSESDEDVEMEDRTPAVVTTGKRKAEDSPTLPAKKSKTTNGSTTGAKHESGSTKTVFVGNLSWAVDNDRLSQEFADCGEVISVRVQLDRNTGKSRGFGYVTFATTEAADAAIALNGTKEIDGRTLNLDKSTDNGANKEKRAQAFGDARSEPSTVLFVGNLSWNTAEDTLWDVFSEYGEVSSVRLPTDKESGKPKGYGYVEFSVINSAQKAIDAMNGKELDGRPIRLDFSQPRDASGAGRGRGIGFGGRGRRGYDGGRGRGSGRGRGGDRGRGRGGARGGIRTGAIATSEGQKIMF